MFYLFIYHYYYYYFGVILGGGGGRRGGERSDEQTVASAAVRSETAVSGRRFGGAAPSGHSHRPTVRPLRARSAPVRRHEPRHVAARCWPP